MKYNVHIKKRVNQSIHRLPVQVKMLLYLLIADLQTEGPIQKSWQIFSPLKGDQFHCHLTNKYVACWTCKKKEILIEVYYVGSREKAPY